MEARVRRLVSSIALTLLLLLALLPTAVPVAASSDLTIAGAEAHMLSLMNARRTAAGLLAYRLDSRLTALARGRSQDMVDHDYFSHTQPDGRSIFDLITGSGMTWYAAGEIIAWNNYPTLDTSAAAADLGWWGSPGHKAVMMSSGYNYVGIGLALSPDGRKYWTAVTLKGPDRTGAWSRMTGLKRSSAGTTTSVPLTVSWTGGDTRLQVLTAGLATYQVQRRTDGGAWVTAWTTTYTKVTRWHARGHRFEYRVRGIDRRGNAGPWSPAISITT
jgi:uncharacterized protein YkwD